MNSKQEQVKIIIGYDITLIKFSTVIHYTLRVKPMLKLSLRSIVHNAKW